MADIKTLKSESVYKADHGGEKFLIVAESGGVKFKVHTWSPTIAQVGFEGEVEKYTDKGGDECVSLPKKDDWKSNKPKSGSSYSRDDDAIKAQWAIGQAVAWISANKLEAAAIEPQAKEFYKMIERVKGSKPVSGKEVLPEVREKLGGQEVELTEEEYDLVDKPLTDKELAGIPF